MLDTPITLTTEDFATGYLSESHGRDYFTLSVTAGQTYSIAVIGIGQDPLTGVTVSAFDEHSSLTRKYFAVVHASVA